MFKKVYKLKSNILVYPGMNAWRFLIVPKSDSQKIKESFGKSAKGWGSIPVSVKVGKTIWKTSIFPDKKSATYLLPLKAKVRKAEEIFDNDNIVFTITIDL